MSYLRSGRAMTLAAAGTAIIMTAVSGYAVLRPVGGVCDFGIIHEAAGKQKRRVMLVNDGPEETVITRVRPTCGCTAADFSDGPVAPGDTAWVDIIYNPDGRPGRINKAVKIYSAGNDILSLGLSGVVIGTPETLSLAYPVEAGPIRLTEKVISGGEMTKGSSRHFFINFCNTTDRVVTPKLESDLDGNLMTLDIVPDSVPPGEIGTISLYLNTRYDDRTGAVSYPVTLRPDTSDQTQPEAVSLELRAFISPARQSDVLRTNKNNAQQDHEKP